MANIAAEKVRMRKFSCTIYAGDKVGVVRLRRRKKEPVEPKSIQETRYEHLVGINPGIMSFQTNFCGFFHDFRF